MSGAPRDRFDDAENEYRVRYLASSRRGCYLEVLDHFRPNDQTEAGLAAIAVDPGRIDITDEELSGAVPERWLSEQRFARAAVPDGATFADVNNQDLLNELNNFERVQQALHDPLVRVGLGAAASLDQETIRLAGPVGRKITQAVGRVIYEDGRFAGISYLSRLGSDERCWAVFDDKLHVTFDSDEPLDITEPERLRDLNIVARAYRLRLPLNWIVELS